MDTAINNYQTIAKNQFRLYGFARSGQHAISHWLMSHAPPPSMWLNNIQGPRDYQRYLYGQPVDGKLELLGLGFEGNLEEKAKFIPDVPMILVVRDILNQTASIAKHYFQPVDDKFFKCWEMNLRQALGEIDVIQSPYTVVNFNKWVTSKNYREDSFNKIMNMLNCCYPFTDVGRDEVLGVGGGSSFDGMKYRSSAEQMNVLQRYKDPLVQDAIKKIPQSLIRLSDVLFNQNS